MTRRTRMAAAGGTLLVALVLMEGRSFTWGGDGHRLVARIAAKHLQPGPRARIALILGTTVNKVEFEMAKAATWPDAINKTKTGTRLWHFLDAPIAGAFTTDGLCGHHECATDRIEEMERRLQSNETGFSLLTTPQPNQPMTYQELAFLIHFVGDIHQPLHAANNGDRGGNCVTLSPAIPHTINGHHFETSKLHSYWDDDEVFGVVERHHNTEGQTAADLFKLFTTGAVVVAQKSPIEWTEESNALARSEIYRRLSLPSHPGDPGVCAVDNETIAIPSDYLTNTVSVAEQQLVKAGIRLGNVLNTICAAPGCAANPKKHT